MYKLREQYVQNEVNVLKEIKGCVIDDMVGSLLIEGSGVLYQSTISKEQRHILDIIRSIRETEHDVTKYRLTGTMNWLEYSIAAETRYSKLTLKSRIEDDSKFIYSQCSVKVSGTFSSADDYGIIVDAEDWLSLEERSRSFTVSTGIVRVPKDVEGRVPYVSRLTGHRLYFN